MVLIFCCVRGYGLVVSVGGCVIGGSGFIIGYIIRKGVLGIFLGLGIVDIVGRGMGCNGGCRRFGGRVRP